MSIYAKEFLAIFFAFKEFGHIFWGTPEPVIILTDNKSGTRFFQTKIIPPTLWNACDYVIQFNFTKAHIPGKNNTAADYLSRLEISPKEKLFLRIREDIPTTPIELHVQSAGVSEEEQIFYTEDDDETEEQILQRKKDARDNPANQLPDISFEKFTTHKSDYHKLSTLQKLSYTNSIAVEQNNDVILQQLRLKILKEAYSETILVQDYQHYCRQMDRLSVMDAIITRQYFDGTGAVKYNQVLLPKHLVQELLQSLHGKANKHPGISKMLIEIRQQYYYPGIAKIVKKWVQGCGICIKDKRIPNSFITPEVLNLPEWDLGPEDAMQIDSLPNLPPSGGYENIITAMDVFSRYLFAYPVTDATATNTAKVIIDIMTKHTYLPTTLITDKETAFTSKLIAEIAQNLGIQLKCATTKHPQTIGKLERTHASLKTNLKMASGDYWRQWHKYLPLAVLNYYTTYHASLGCGPSRIFHGRIPYNILDNKLGLNPNPKVLPTTDFADEFQRRTQILLDSTKKNIMQSYLKYKEYYDRKAKAAPLRQNDYCFILQPIADHQGSKFPFREYRWTGPYIVEKVLTNENYIVRKLNSNKTQILHRIRLRKYEPNTALQDNSPEGNLQPDDEIIIPQDDLYVITWETSFGDFPDPTAETANPTRLDTTDTPNSFVDNTSQPDEIFTDVDLRSTGPHQSDTPVPLEKIPLESTNEWLDDQQSSCGSDTIVPEVLDDGNDMIVENESPRGGKYNLRPNPTPNFTDEYRY